MASATEQRLWLWVKKFSNHFSANEYRELHEVSAALQDPSLPVNRKRALVFSMYQLLIDGAIAEHDIQQYQSEFPDFVGAQLNDPLLEHAVVEAWKGSAYTPPRSNILGSVAFMVVLLFFFESCCRMRLNDDDSTLQKMLKQLKERGSIDQETCVALIYLAELRNVWHNFGLHKPSKGKRFYQPKSVPLIFPDLIPGQVIKPLGEEQTLHLLDKVLTTFCELTGV
jgi:hypothetical protein